MYVFIAPKTEQCEAPGPDGSAAGIAGPGMEVKRDGLFRRQPPVHKIT